ncbi:MAG: SAM-dependent methyltransferase, partial [Gammaproteobacteria bacterium]
LDANYRDGISSFARIEKAALDRGLASLQLDLENGHWQARHGHVLALAELDLGYLFMKFSPAGKHS